MSKLKPIDVFGKSICANCSNMFMRVIKLVSQEDIDYYSQYVDIDNLDDYDISIEQYKCLVTQEDINGEVVKCNSFFPCNKVNLIREYRF